ncbi:hypothetical protein LV84_03323 [Algoriphagus ratkowskyi]|uniref:Type II toxin-antitoxin system RelE/ParE family toxin n=1 Tax=Algoriphagus ratkowskyi TaxID=57028 RepID=A0A2W7R1J8_9BACT|nr:type II toxin-antitoxin system RelE/ParE family toxin [Algoriphagus ratkowskyi]PZX53116.1 hypothetical protein LV84_03323 [Algoriphagus ratkowskyi]TXD76394.1 type II toxin-antitoxin system RelE/ParE family toxin [Algoriphagus ratkowskyi]
MTYLLSQEAEDDIVRIYRFGFINFGEAQADKYFEALINWLNELVKFLTSSRKHHIFDNLIIIVFVVPIQSISN